MNTSSRNHIGCVLLVTLAAAACGSGQSTAHSGPSAAPARFLPNEGAATTLAALAAAAGLGEQAAAGGDAAAPAALLERALQTTSATDRQDQLRSQRTSFEAVGAVVLQLPLHPHPSLARPAGRASMED